MEVNRGLEYKILVYSIDEFRRKISKINRY